MHSRGEIRRSKDYAPMRPQMKSIFPFPIVHPQQSRHHVARKPRQMDRRVIPPDLHSRQAAWVSALHICSATLG